ncbi:MAG: class I SAM-dependent methyltransferase [Planctomycetota bacterium]|jgi:tellurite methyltransferase
MEYDNIYRDHKDYFGAEPDPLLNTYWSRLDQSRLVLDIGAGQGRNTFFLARQGIKVEALDPSRVAMEKIKKSAAQAGLSIQTHACGFHEFKPKRKDFGGLLAFGLVQVLTWNSILNLIERLRRWSSKGSLVFITAFSTEDDSFARWSKECKRKGKNSYLDMHGNVRTYLEPKEILDLFPDFKVVHHWEGLGEEHSHGDGPKERHARIEAIFERM